MTTFADLNTKNYAERKHQQRVTQFLKSQGIPSEYLLWPNLDAYRAVSEIQNSKFTNAVQKHKASAFARAWISHKGVVPDTASQEVLALVLHCRRKEANQQFRQRKQKAKAEKKLRRELAQSRSRK